MEPVDEPNEIGRRLLESYKLGFAPPPHSRERIWQQVQAPAADDTQPRSRWGLWWVAIPLVAAAAMSLMWCGNPIAMVVGSRDKSEAAEYDHQRSGPTRSTAELRSRTSPRAPRPIVLEAAIPSEEKAAVQAKPIRSTPPAPTRNAKTRRATPHKATSPADDAEPDLASPSIATLLPKLEEVDRLIRKGRARTALTLLRTHKGDLTHAGLGEEHDGYELVARCKLGQGEESTTLRARFEQRYPHSLYAARVAQACAGATDKSHEQ